MTYLGGRGAGEGAAEAWGRGTPELRHRTCRRNDAHRNCPNPDQPDRESQLPTEAEENRSGQIPEGLLSQANPPPRANPVQTSPEHPAPASFRVRVRDRDRLKFCPPATRRPPGPKTSSASFQDPELK